MQRGATPSYFEADGADGLGTITSLTNPSGNVTQSYAFDSFGVRTSGAPTVTNSFQYTARELDSETGWYYYRARYYAPLLGRFISEDPIQFRGDVDFYPYVGNNPALRIDPRGLIHQAWNEPPFDGRLHDDPGAGLEVLCTKGRNIQRDIEWLEHSITVRQAEIFKLGREADLGHLDRLEAEIATLDRCYDKCDKDTKPVPVPAPAPARSRRRVPSTLPNVPAPSPATQTGLYGTVLLILTLLLVFAAA
jgi:RHS repeat-associated protein